ncbi:MAG: hypothetical protein K9G67_12065 [Bacteroidales bacterium]|nr:hypothetical protein [Bacteroidales bacterium]MCF8345011.1 hypothetical protein [Bacteroidales bacterium]MCF8351386.1 hypothetical protein [Bacteroidales bacterium]MCF8377083.1 hypothetical protein [Bacteroidales bacterium]MCF8402165.1 hypothetical protein [Bacteroidales bacterium]
MAWILIGILYIGASLILYFEGRNRRIGGVTLLIIGFFLTPLIGFIILNLSKKRINFHHFVKLKTDKLTDESVIKTMHSNGSDQWVEIKASELNIG